MAGEGRYSWVGLDGELRHGAHWNDLPAEMDRLVAFVPDMLPEPHTQADHDAMDQFPTGCLPVTARSAPSFVAPDPDPGPSLGPGGSFSS